MQLDDIKISESYKIQIIITLVIENNLESLFGLVWFGFWSRTPYGSGYLRTQCRGWPLLYGYLSILTF